MRIKTNEGAEIHAPSELVSVRKNDDGKCTVWVSGTCVGCIEEEIFDAVASMIFTLEKRHPMGPEFVIHKRGRTVERLFGEWGHTVGTDSLDAKPPRGVSEIVKE